MLMPMSSKRSCVRSHANRLSLRLLMPRAHRSSRRRKDAALSFAKCVSARSSCFIALPEPTPCRCCLP